MMLGVYMVSMVHMQVNVGKNLGTIVHQHQHQQEDEPSVCSDEGWEGTGLTMAQPT